ncbi:PilZ domain-containing protein [Cohnella cholangitidis]|nr:PilZ domain-containing protein [Cohnella cholangitidis]
MEWDQASLKGIISPQMYISLILVGIRKDATPFCFEERFSLVSMNKQELVVSFDYTGANPFDQLQSVHFTELSFRNRGVLYHTITEFIRIDYRQSLCLITLRTPTQLTQQQHRRFPRVILTDKMPAQCRIVGLRQKVIHHGASFPIQIVEISEGGLSFISSVRLFYPIYLQFHFSLPSGARILELNGEIVRINPFGNDAYRAAAEFRDVPEDIQSLLADYCIDCMSK